jgi:proline dehydrogenase
MDSQTKQESNTLPDFSNTEIAFSNKSNSELKKAEFLFKMMNNPTLVKVLSNIGLIAVKYRLPFANFFVKKTIFEQFCGGEDLLSCQKSIDKLYKFNTLSVLDYGAEAKETDEDFEAVVDENIKAIEMAASNNSVPVISTKITGLTHMDLLEAMDRKDVLTEQQKADYQSLIKRIDIICNKASKLGIAVFIDAEESWIQDTIDAIAMKMMETYNKEKVAVFNTYQLYRHDKLQDLKNDHKVAKEKGFILGAKLVRGAYMEKERKRAMEMGYKSPIQPDKIACDKDYDSALQYCFENYETISVCCASHNLDSNLLLAQLIKDNKLDKTHPHFNFCQLYGMSDYITFNLAKKGYNAAKYVVYGPVEEVVPYLVRRAQENTSVSGEMGRELSLINKEVTRRKL